MKSKILFLLFIQSLFFLLISCERNRLLLGSWENENQILVINDDNTFELKNKNAAIVKSFRGKCFYSSQRLMLQFREYQDENQEWISLDGTDLESYYEKITFQINDDKLITRIENTGKVIEYSRVIKL